MICAFVFAYAKSRFSHDAAQLKTHNPVYSTSLDYGLSIGKSIEWQRLASHVQCPIRDDLSTGKYYLPTFIKLQVYYPLGTSL